METKVVFAVLQAFLLVCAPFLASNVRSVSASSTIYVRPDGSVDPSTAPIERVGDVYVLTDDVYDAIYVERSNVVVDGVGHAVQYGLHIQDANNVTIQKMEINSEVFILSSSNRILQNNITAFYRAIRLWGSNNSVSENIVTQSGRGIDVRGSNNTIQDNSFTDNDVGFWLDIGSNNVLRNNRMAGNRINFAVYPGHTPSDFINYVDSSNTVDGKPIYWWIDKQDMVVPSDAGFVALVNCTRITTQNLDLENNLVSLYLVSTTNSTVTRNNMTSNDFTGMWLLQSSNNSISDNKMANNTAAMFIDFSDHNKVSRNNIANNGEGIHLVESSYNTISENNITGNASRIGILLDQSSNFNYVFQNEIATSSGGIYVINSSYNRIVENEIATTYGTGMDVLGIFSNGNVIFHNNFMSNKTVYSNTYFPQIWDDGYPSGGNYWGDYKGTDLYTGPYQNMTGSDGIGDTYKPIGNDADRYPFMNPWRPPIPGDINKDAKVDVRDLTLVAKAFGSYEGHLNWNPIGDINHDGKIDIKDLVLIAKNFGRVQP